MNITVGIPTKDRYASLQMCLMSIAMQTYKPVEIIIVDDTINPPDLRTIPIYKYIFQLLQDKGIEWKIMYGQHKGQHHSHALIQEIAKGDWIFRIDDDCVAEANVLEELSDDIDNWQEYFSDIKVGAIAPLVLTPNASPLEVFIRNDINNLDQPNVQWFKPGKINHGYKSSHDHLYSCFLYKKGITSYELNLSPVAHREETLFTHKISRAGYELCVDSDTVVHHFRSETGGIRSHQDQSYYDHDEGVFKSLLSLWNVNPNAKKVVVLDNGIGDHFAFKHILPELKQRHSKIQIACCFNDVFFDEPDVELISIADAYNMFHGCLDEFNIYRKLHDWNWKPEDGNLVAAFEKLYLQ